MVGWTLHVAHKLSEKVHSICCRTDRGLYCGLNKGKLAVLTYRNNDALFTCQTLILPLDGNILRVGFATTHGGMLCVGDSRGRVLVLCPNGAELIEVAEFKAPHAITALHVHSDATGDYTILAADLQGTVTSYAPFHVNYRLQLQDIAQDTRRSAVLCMVSLTRELPKCSMESEDDVEDPEVFVDEVFVLACCTDGKIYGLSATGAVVCAVGMPQGTVPTCAVVPLWYQNSMDPWCVVTADDGCVYSLNAIDSNENTDVFTIQRLCDLDYPLTHAAATAQHLVCIGQSTHVSVLATDGQLLYSIALPDWPVCLTLCGTDLDGVEEVAIGAGDTVFVLRAAGSSDWPAQGRALSDSQESSS
mmetsp:Transcript_142295/g.248120  ORF Transcript_142295/g.248120 Transcript_142295/m.248120 type:complete len:360 (-) Transcript_142295:145-1224(-)